LKNPRKICYPKYNRVPTTELNNLREKTKQQGREKRMTYSEGYPQKRIEEGTKAYLLEKNFRAIGVGKNSG